jgi:hypothetical protein
MLDFVTRTARSLLGFTGRDIAETVHETHDLEEDMLAGVEAIESATASLERHVEVIETLATSVDPLRASVDRLTDTMQELVALLAPMGAAEHEVERVGRLFGRHRHHEEAAQTQPAPGGDPPERSS